MSTLIIYAHPQRDSFNRAILENVSAALQKKNERFSVIDLYREHFDPVLTDRDFAKNAKGEFADPQAQKYCKMIKDADKLVSIFPVWWSLMPAILKGFFDKVFIKNYAYYYEGMFPRGLFTNIKKSLVISTMNSPRFYYTLFLDRKRDAACASHRSEIWTESGILSDSGRR